MNHARCRFKCNGATMEKELCGPACDEIAALTTRERRSEKQRKRKCVNGRQHLNASRTVPMQVRELDLERKQKIKSKLSWQFAAIDNHRLRFS